MEEQAEQYRTQKSNNNLLLVASARGYLADVEALIERGAELDCRDRAKLTPLHYAAGRGRLDIVRALKARGVDLDPESPDGRTPLHLAALRGHAAVAGFLAGSGAWVGAFDGSDSTPLHLAARHGHEAAAEALLSHGADPGLTNKFGLRPVDEAAYAAGLGNLAAVRMLLGDGADVNGTANDGTTALHAATLAADADCVALLLESGAAASAADAKGRTAADLAEEQDRQAAARAKEEAERPPLVRPGDAPNPPPLSRAALARAAALGPREAFLALAPGDRLRKVERWASLPPDDLDAALAGFEAGVQAEVQSRLEALRTTAAHLNIHKAITALHEDEEFQADAARPEVRAGIEAIRKDTSLYDSYARDPVMLSVLQKLRRVHAVSSANKQRTVDLDLLLNTPGEPRQPPERSSWRAWRRLVGQMAGTPKEAGADTSLPDEGAGAGPEAAAAPSARRRVPDWLRDGFSWPKVWAELWRQCQLALLILAVFLVTSSVLRGKLPWAAREAGPGDRDALDLAGLLLGQGRGEL
ncbi:Ankyrin repeat and protein kinase domain-containing protein 1 [Auxenochlorella protothecoides]|uniref:Ankyrin repeat and protein kinase domain-containing protein 1 n=1 Tax=Auxenochlorella protothecoides TaxID=3075 RepID=A0A087SF00_AUXPR|nr:Ankyrin repeat and protein kinase domain-containing protein 1 [Auxenochlorella protothecoides]KFM24304.1 Ankyrin repeat and protein kinase domain-containing protein 1 [Auxenochlorella protothecoides]